MKKFVGPLILGIVALLLIIAVVGLAARLIKGAFNAVLGIVVIVALIAIVVWMFAYAAKHKKK